MDEFLKVIYLNYMEEKNMADDFFEYFKEWESLKVYTENAEKNVEFWKSTAQAVNRLRVQLL